MPSITIRILSAPLLALAAHIQRRARLYSKIASWGPYLTGPLFILIDPSEFEALLALKRYVAVLLLLLSWEVLLGAAVGVRSSAERQAHLKGEHAAKRARPRKSNKDTTAPAPGDATLPPRWSFTTMDKVRIIIATLMILLTIDLFHGYFQEVAFLLVLATLTCGALTRFLQRDNPLRAPRYLMSLTPELLYLTGIGYLTCIAMRGGFYQQPAVVSAAVAAMTMTPALLQHLIARDASGSSVAPDRRYLLRALELLVCIGPVAIALLVYSQQLAISYLLVLLSFIPGGRLLRLLPQKASSEQLRPELQGLGAATAISFLAILLGLRVI